MNRRIIEKKLKHFFIRFEIAFNRLLGREFIAANFDEFHIETTSACNLKCKFCPYENKISPKVSMTNETFMDVVEQAVNLGFNRFQLTPCTGDIFMDKHIFEKFAILDSHSKVKSYSFYSNLTIPTRAQLLKLLHLKKLGELVISVYGHDESSFVSITKSNPKIYRRLIENIKTIIEFKKDWPFRISFGHRSTLDDFNLDSSDLMRLLGECQKLGMSVQFSGGIYNNWGGSISQEDVEGLNMRIAPANEVYKSGTCAFLLEWVQVLSTGVVNGCSCRDVEATLAIGDINIKSLASIISSRNSEYMKIIDEQQKGNFRPVCASCDFYRSIYHKPKGFRKGDIPSQTLKQYLEKINRE